LRQHLHLLQSEEAARAGEPWRRVDVAGHPFRPAGEDAGLPEDAGELLERALDHVVLRVHRCPELGMLSGLDEPLEAFRSRVLAGIRPQVQRRVRERGEGPLDPELPALVSRLAHGLESREFVLEPGMVLTARMGRLLLPPGVTLPPPGVHDPMVAGGPTGSRG